MTTSKYIAGRADSGGSCSISVNLTPETIEEWSTLIDSYNSAHADGRQLWFKVSSSGLGGKSFYFIGEPPQDIPMPESSQNELWVVEIPLSIVDYIGLD